MGKKLIGFFYWLLFGKVAEKVDKVFFIIAICCLLLGCFIMVLEVASRDIFGISLVWAEETTRYFTIMAVFLIIGPLVKQNAHIRVIFLFERLSKKYREILDVVLSFIGAFTCVICFLSSAKFVAILSLIGAKSISGTPFHPWTWQIPAFIGMGFGVLYFLCNALKIIWENVIRKDANMKKAV